MQLNFNGRDLVSMSQLTKEEILHVLLHASQLKQEPQSDLLKGKLMGSCFFEPSTRTRLSFEAAMHRLGGQVVGFSDKHATSAAKGEAFSDTIRTIGQYTDVIILRHYLEGAAQKAAEMTDIPIINGGDGSNQHPTQTLLDLFTIQECRGTLENLHIAIVGDLKHGRTVHSLAQAMGFFSPRFYFVSPQGLEMPDHLCHELRKQGVKFSLHHALEEVLKKCDILYMTRIQEERFIDKWEYEKVKFAFTLTLDMLRSAQNASLRILHPLPRLKEIERAIDGTGQAYYFEQAKNGLFIRQALLGLILGNLR